MGEDMGEKGNRFMPGKKSAHVLFLIDQLCVAGGAERAILQTIRLLPKDRFRSTLITFKLDEKIELFRSLPCQSYVLPLRRTYDWNSLRVAQKIRRFIRGEGVDIVHTFHETSDLWGGLVSRVKDAPALVSSRRDMGILRTTKHRVAYRLMRSSFDLVLTVSDEVRRYCIEADGLAPHKVATLYNGVELEYLTRSNGGRSLREQFGFESSAPVVLTVANISKVKGIDVLIKVAARVAHEIPDVLFVIVGANVDGEYFKTIEVQIVELGMQRNVRLVGQTENVASFLKMADVFFLPSRSEGFSNALIEAMGCGLPCVATDVGGNSEAIRDGVSGFIVENENAESAADRILKLLREPGLARTMAAAGKCTVSERFTTKIMIDQLTGHYNHLLAARAKKNAAAT